MCATYGDRATVDVDVNSQGSSLRPTSPLMPRALVSKSILVFGWAGWLALALRRGGSILP